MPKDDTIKRFKLMEGVGPHFEPNPDFDKESPEDEEDNPRDIEYAPGEVVKSTRKLDKIFANKFKPLSSSKSAKEEEPEEDVEDAEDEEAVPEDVTDEFEGAAEGGLKVLKDSEGKYRVYEEGEDEPMDGAKKGFTTKKKTLAFVKNNVKSEEEED